MFGDSFWPRQVGRTATKLSYVTQNSLHCPLHFIASRRSLNFSRLFPLPRVAPLGVKGRDGWNSDYSRRQFECYFFKSPHYVPPGIRWEDPNGVGDGQQLYFLPGLTHFVSRKNIALLLNKLKFEKTDNVFIKGLHSGLWQNFLLLLAQMVVEQEADKLFS